MTDFERACVAAFHARRNHGEWSSEYRLALDEMDRHRPDWAPPVPRRRCQWCGRADGHSEHCKLAIVTG